VVPEQQEEKRRMPVEAGQKILVAFAGLNPREYRGSGDPSPLGPRFSRDGP